LLQVDDLTVRYSSSDRGELVALEGVNCEIGVGEAVGLLGESGCGKTTLGLALLGLLPTDGNIIRGSAIFGGRNLLTLRERELRKVRGAGISMVHQEPGAALNPVLRVGEQVAEVLRAHRRLSRERAREEARVLLAQVGLARETCIEAAYPHQLSGGQRQRVAIARALAARPEVLLADEPVSMLDVSIRLDVLNLLLRLKDEERLALLFITHDIASARYFAENTLVMYAGQTVEGGPSEEVIQRPKHPYTQLLISAAPDPDRPVTGEQKKNIPARGEIPSLINPPSGCRFHPRCPHAMPVCSERFPGRTDLGGGHWTHCFLYGDGDEQEKESTASEQTEGEDPSLRSG